MSVMTQGGPRVIIDDFAAAVDAKKRKGPKPETFVINFRDEQRIQHEREVFLVPTELLRFRKDNGRIASDVMHYEKFNGVLDEKSSQSQNIIRGFLERKDPERTDELRKSLQHTGQKEPAIVSCDGFLINGNRRLMALQKLFEDTRDTKFDFMKVVILPGKHDPGGPPTIREIEQIENRYQLQSEGKAEYTAFDKALSIRRKIKAGMTIEEQLRDDPKTAGLSKKEFEEEARRTQEKYLAPLDCVDEYLSHFERPGLYGTIAAHVGDREGRWIAFVDYSGRLNKILADERGRQKHGINEREVGTVKDVVFKLVRKRSFPELPKLHKIVRDLPKYFSNKDAKKELMKISDIPATLSGDERKDSNGRPLGERELDLRWGEKYANDIIRQVKRAMQIHTQRKEQEKPIDLLIGALNKLNNAHMEVSEIGENQLTSARDYASQIQTRAKEIEAEIIHQGKEMRKQKLELRRKFGNKHGR